MFVFALLVLLCTYIVVVAVIILERFQQRHQFYESMIDKFTPVHEFAAAA